MTYIIYLQNMQIRNARTAKGADAKRASPWAVWELFWDLSSPPWVFCLSREGRSLFCGGRFSSRINEKLHLSHEKSIFTIYLTSCIPKARIRRRWLMLAYSAVFLMHPLPLLWYSVGRLNPPAAEPIESLAFLMFTVSRKLILQCKDEIWHTTGSLREILKEGKEQSVAGLKCSSWIMSPVALLRPWMDDCLC